MQYFSWIQPFWSVKNNPSAIDAIKKISSRIKALSISTYDFSTLYTIIPQNKLKNVMRKLINCCFKVEEEQFIAVTKYGATWTDNKNIFKINFDKTFLKLVINFFL